MMKWKKKAREKKSPGISLFSNPNEIREMRENGDKMKFFEEKTEKIRKTLNKILHRSS